MNRHIFIANKLLLLFSNIHKGKLKKHSKEQKTTYIYEDRNFIIDDAYISHNWTKSAIKQFLYYVSVVNKDGEAYFIEDKDIVEKTNLSIRTIEENNREFKKSGILEFQRIQSKSLHISITNYQENVRDVYKSDEEDEDTGTNTGTSSVDVPTGYTSIWHEDMKKILSINNINELRFVLKTFAWYEKDIYLNKKDEWFISYARLATAVPQYLQYPAALKEIIENVSSIVPIKCIHGYEDLKNTFNEYGNRGAKVVEIFKYKMVGVLNKFDDSKTRRYKEYKEAQHELNLFKQRLLQSEITVSEMDTKNFNAIIDKFGIDALKETFKRIFSYLNDYDTDGRQRIINQLTCDFENYIYSVIKRINLKTLVS